MPRKNPENWTVVQHSAYGYKKDYEFQYGLESRLLKNKRETALARKAGGLIFDDYMAAEDYCMNEMYPEETKGITPRSPGNFSTKSIGGLRIYLPKVEIAQ